MSALPSWLSRRLTQVKKTGRFCICDESKFDPQFLSLPDVVKVLWVAKHIDLSRTSLATVTGLPNLPHLSTFTANRTSISNFENFNVLKTASALSFKNTPLSELRTYKLGILLAVGIKSIGSIDGMVVGQKLKEKYQTYPRFCSELVVKGWIPEYPCPDTERLREICAEFDVEPVFEDFMPSEMQPDMTYEDEGDNNDLEFEELVGKLREKHEEVITRGQAMFGMVEDGQEFSDRVVDVFKTHGMDLEGLSEDGIIGAVRKLCDVAESCRSNSVASPIGSLP